MLLKWADSHERTLLTIHNSCRSRANSPTKALLSPLWQYLDGQTKRKWQHLHGRKKKCLHGHRVRPNVQSVCLVVSGVCSSNATCRPCRAARQEPISRVLGGSESKYSAPQRSIRTQLCINFNHVLGRKL